MLILNHLEASIAFYEINLLLIQKTPKMKPLFLKLLKNECLHKVSIS